MVETSVEYRFALGTFVLFCAVAAATIVGVPLFWFFYGFSLFDWVTCAILYVVTGTGITIGYHRLIAHRSFACHPWVTVGLLIAGGWALQISP